MAAVLFGMTLGAIPLVGCGDDAPDTDKAASPSPVQQELQIGLPRPFELGLSSFPPESTESAYEKTFELAGEAGEIVLIQRTPPWKEFLPGGSLSRDTENVTRTEVLLAEENNLQIFLGIDPTDPADRGKLNLPEEMQGKGFGDEDVRLAFIAYVKYVTLNYKPRYLAIGLEVNMYYREQPDDFDNFVSLYQEAYDEVKRISPDTFVFPTFQLEEMLSLLSPSATNAQQWQLLKRFEGKMDVMALTTYPSFVFDKPEAIPTNYLGQVGKYTNLPVAIAAAGYSSGPGRDGLNEGSEGQQASFLRWLIAQASQLKMPFVVWNLITDPVEATPPPFDLYNNIGLRRADGSAKPAWDFWVETAARPLEPFETHE